jgi:hypothetical protein
MRTPTGFIKPQSRAGRVLLWIVAALVLLAILLFIASILIEEPMRRTIEQRMNQALDGYSVEVPELDFRLLGLSITVHDMVLRQDAHPEPPVAVFPELKANIHWRQLLRGSLVSNWRIYEPTFVVNLAQLREEWEDPRPVDERGWREALEQIHPLRFDKIEVINGEITYIDEEFDHPLTVSELNVTLENIRTRGTPDERYPSPFRVDAVVLEDGALRIEGDADFLAEPHPAILARIDLRNVPLERIGPVASRADLWISEGAFSAIGGIEFTPEVKNFHFTSVEIDRLHLDYLYTERPEEPDDPPFDLEDVTYRLDHLRVSNAEIGLVNHTEDPDYRIFLSGAQINVHNVSDRFGEGPAQAHITGRFMGSGETEVNAEFRPETEGADFDLSVRIEGTSIPAMSDILQAHVGLEPSEGWFALYSEVTVRDGRIDGYARPFIEELQIHDPEEDKGLLRELYEKTLDAIASLLENPEDEIATEFDLSGEIDDPDASTWQIIANLLRNAFLEAIIPGFRGG